MSEWSLECGACGFSRNPEPADTVCPECGKPFLVRYDLSDCDGNALREIWRSRRGGGMWRFRELLPLHAGEEPVTLAEGDTPLLPLEIHDSPLKDLRVLVKDEGRNPTGSFKDRGLAAAVTRAVLDGTENLVVPSAGNAAAALAAYAARASVTARIFIPADTPEGVIRRCDHYGAEIVRVDGLIDECGRLAALHSAETGAFNVSTLREPYRIEGKKTMMLEIVEQLGWKAPDAIVYPTGGGTGLIGAGKALAELSEFGLVEAGTRFYAVQGAGCAPIVRAWREGWDEAPPWKDARTNAFGLRVPGAIGDFLILRAVRESGGGAIAVQDEAMCDGAARLGRGGISASIEGGATLAAADRLAEAGELKPGELVVLFNTANAITY